MQYSNLGGWGWGVGRGQRRRFARCPARARARAPRPPPPALRARHDAKPDGKGERKRGSVLQRLEAKQPAHTGQRRRQRRRAAANEAHGRLSFAMLSS